MEFEEVFIAKRAEIEALGLFRNLYACPYCIDGYVPIRSSVSEAMVHPDTPIGRILCLPRDKPVSFGRAEPIFRAL